MPCSSLILIYLSTAVGLTPGGSTHLHINNTQNITINNKTTRITNKTTQINLEECWPCPVLLYSLLYGVLKIFALVKMVFFVRKPCRYVMITNIHRLWENEIFFATCIPCDLS
jgi:hypothetical protein